MKENVYNTVLYGWKPLACTLCDAGGWKISWDEVDLLLFVYIISNKLGYLQCTRTEQLSNAACRIFPYM